MKPLGWAKGQRSILICWETLMMISWFERLTSVLALDESQWTLVPMTCAVPLYKGKVDLQEF